MQIGVSHLLKDSIRQFHRLYRIHMAVLLNGLSLEFVYHVARQNATLVLA